jgi:hypothetical protein
MGVVNSGFFFVRNSEWSRGYLREWLREADDTAAVMMDQIAFDKLYRSKLPGVKSHIAILRPDALNSRLPSWRHQLEHNQVLHLAAASHLLRRETFRKALKTVCDHVRAYNQTQVASGSGSGSSAAKIGGGRDGPAPLPRQLGLSREALQHLRLNLPIEEVIIKATNSLDKIFRSENFVAVEKDVVPVRSSEQYVYS